MKAWLLSPEGEDSLCVSAAPSQLLGELDCYLSVMVEERAKAEIAMTSVLEGCSLQAKELLSMIVKERGREKERKRMKGRGGEREKM